MAWKHTGNTLNYTLIVLSSRNRMMKIIVATSTNASGRSAQKCLAHVLVQVLSSALYSQSICICVAFVQWFFFFLFFSPFLFSPSLTHPPETHKKVNVFYFSTAAQVCPGYSADQNTLLPFPLLLVCLLIAFINSAIFCAQADYSAVWLLRGWRIYIYIYIYTRARTRTHTPSTAFRQFPPNSAIFGYAIKGALFISAQLSTIHHTHTHTTRSAVKWTVKR